MNYKTSEVAEQLAISSKSLLKIAKQLAIPKNKYGHYIYREPDIKKIAECLASPTPKHKAPTNTPDISPIQQQIDSLELRLKDAESTINKKADDVVSYQLLQHRQELEELHEKITTIEDKISKIEEQFLHYEAIPATEDASSKKKSFFKSIFGTEGK